MSKERTIDSFPPWSKSEDRRLRASGEKTVAVRNKPKVQTPRHVMVFAVFTLLFLAGCNMTNSGGITVNKYTGTTGLVVEFPTSSPPEIVYEGRPFPVKVSVQNTGAFNVSYDKMRITFSTDPLYIKSGLILLDPQKVDPDYLDAASRYKEILGRGIIYPDGETQIFSVPTDSAFSAKPVLGQRQMPETEILAGVCYAYTTYLSAPVCIDTNTYNQNERAQSCKAEDLTFTGGQGAPIEITKIDVRAVPAINPSTMKESVRPEFTLYIKNSGGGYLIGPDDMPMDTACLLKGIPQEKLNAVKVSATLMNTPLDCKPSNIVKVDEDTKVSCTVPDTELTNPIYSVKQNFDSLLIINLTYLYKTSASTKVKIERTETAAYDTTTALGKTKGYAYDGDTPIKDADGSQVTLCRYYAQNPDKAPELSRQNLNSEFSCACSLQRCLTLNKDGKCLNNKEWCPGDTYCCYDPSVSTTGAAGTSFEDMQATIYNLPDCSDFPSWSQTGKVIGSLQGCSMKNGFYEQVRCQGSGTCEGNEYHASTISPTDKTKTGKIGTACGTTPTPRRTIAVNNDAGTNCYIPYGSKVELDFGSNNPWNGVYVAEDTGSAINGCHIDVFVGSGKSALAQATRDGLGNTRIKARIIEQGTGCSSIN